MPRNLLSLFVFILMLAGLCQPGFAQKTSPEKKTGDTKSATPAKTANKKPSKTKAKSKKNKNKKSPKSGSTKKVNLQENPIGDRQPLVNPDMTLMPNQNPDGFPQDATRSFFDNSQRPTDAGLSEDFREIRDATKQAGIKRRNIKRPRRVKEPASDKTEKEEDSKASDNQDQADDTEQPDGADQSGQDQDQEDKPFNPFDIESVKHHIHKLTAPEKNRKNSAKHKKKQEKKKVLIKIDPSETPFTSEWNEKHGRRVLGIIAVMVLTLFLAPPVIRRVVRLMTQGRESSEITKRVGTLTLLGSKMVVVVVLVLGLFEILTEFSIDVGPMLTGAGIFGVALGFAGQNLLKDYLAGILLIIEEQMRVGDFVKIAGVSGTVEEISIRKIQLRDFNGNAIYVPNRNVDVVINMTREYSKYVMNVPVAYKEDYDKVVKILREVDEAILADKKFAKIITEPLTIYGLSEFGTNGYVVTIRTTTKPGEQWAAAREYRKRIKERFDALNIEIPVSQMTIHKGTDIKGAEDAISLDEPEEKNGD